MKITFIQVVKALWDKDGWINISASSFDDLYCYKKLGIRTYIRLSAVFFRNNEIVFECNTIQYIIISLLCYRLRKHFGLGESDMKK